MEKHKDKKIPGHAGLYRQGGPVSGRAGTVIFDEEVKKWKFDTIAVHGLYTVRDAIEDYRGSIIEPIFKSSAQACRD